MDEYVPTQFNHKDYKLLAKIAGPGLKYLLIECSYRDKRIQRKLQGWSISIIAALTCPLDQVPLYMGSTNQHTIDIVKWRLTLGK